MPHKFAIVLTKRIDAMAVHPYLFFNGRCDEAIEFYRAAAGAEVTFRTCATRIALRPRSHGHSPGKR